jgi:hypothetical protein
VTITRQGSRKMRRARNHMHAQDPRCNWCGTVTINPPRAGDPNAATVDHIKPRRECRSQQEYESASNHVLACFECNQLRDQVDIALLKHQKEQQAALERLKAPTRRVMVRTRCR